MQLHLCRKVGRKKFSGLDMQRETCRCCRKKSRSDEDEGESGQKS